LQLAVEVSLGGRSVPEISTSLVRGRQPQLQHVRTAKTGGTALESQQSRAYSRVCSGKRQQGRAEDELARLIEELLGSSISASLAFNAFMNATRSAFS